MSVPAKKLTGGATRMTETHEKLLNAILERGQLFISETLGETLTETKRKTTGEHGFKLNQLSTLFDELGIQICTSDEVIVDRLEYEALTVLAHKKLDARVARLEGKERRMEAVK